MVSVFSIKKLCRFFFFQSHCLAPGTHLIKICLKDEKKLICDDEPHTTHKYLSMVIYIRSIYIFIFFRNHSCNARVEERYILKISMGRLSTGGSSRFFLSPSACRRCRGFGIAGELCSRNSRKQQKKTSENISKGPTIFH